MAITEAVAEEPDYREMYDWQQRILARLGRPITGRVLDFGSGTGRLVDLYASEGFDAYGCDITLDRPTDHLRLIQTDPYTIPYPDGFFDVVVSNSVFEHVQNPARAFAEISRVLKPGGVSLHAFPGRYRVKEGHTFVPFASILRARWWLRLWATLGVRNEFQQGLPAKRVAQINRDFLTTQTRYLRRREIRRHAPGVRFVERYHLEFVAEKRGWPRAVRVLAPAYSAFRTRMIVTRG